jgi:hypothetical protein
MRKSIAWLAPTAVISVAALTALALDRHGSIIPQARAAGLNAADSEALCPVGNATLRGTYMSMGGGTVVGVGPVAFIGTLYLDGNGGGTNPFTRSLNGVVLRADVPVTYTVNSDCSGTLTLAGTKNFDLRISPHGSKVDYIETDANTVISGSASRVND